MSDEGLYEQLKKAVDEVSSTAKIRRACSVKKVIDHSGIIPLSEKKFMRFIGDYFREHRALLPTALDIALKVIETKVASGAHPSEITRKRLIETVGVNPPHDERFNKAIREGKHALAAQGKTEIDGPPEGVNVRIFPGGWIDLDSDVWTLWHGRKRVLRREKLRADLRGIAWTILREELEKEKVTLSTVGSYYRRFLWAGDLLGKEVPAVDRSTLEGIQRAWTAFEGTSPKSGGARWALIRIYSRLIEQVAEDRYDNKREMIRIAAWLLTAASVERIPENEDFLTAAELENLVNACISDIKQGLVVSETFPELIGVEASPYLEAPRGVLEVALWGVALMLLVMGYTGLRRESIVRLEVEDLARFNDDLYVLAWRHGKKGEENAVVIPGLIGKLIRLYIARTEPIRRALQTERIFMGRGKGGDWCVIEAEALNSRFLDFAERHELKRGNDPINLTSTILRRTYATRGLYDGRTLRAIGAQLGHSRLETTDEYIKMDRFEHPAQVGPALDLYANNALCLWKHPHILDDLDPAERSFLLSSKVERDQEVGLCRYDRCVEAESGSPPPCSLCRNLVTGHEFLGGWEDERNARMQEIKGLAEDPEASYTLMQKKDEFRRFEDNFAYLKRR